MQRERRGDLLERHGDLQQYCEELEVYQFVDLVTTALLLILLWSRPCCCTNTVYGGRFEQRTGVPSGRKDTITGRSASAHTNF